MRKATSGFTVVELIIVTVVIAIIATISVVSYSGVQAKARNAKVTTGVDIYKKAIINYAAKNNGYPTHFGACLGANYPSNRCWSGPNGSFDVSSGFDTVLGPYLGGVKPVLGTSYLQVTNAVPNPDRRVGAIYFYHSATDVRITYYLEGPNQKCSDGKVGTTELQTTQCRMNLPEV